MQLPRDPIRRFALSALIWMPFTFGLWWLIGRFYFGYMLALPGEYLLAKLMPDLFVGMKAHGQFWTLYTSLSPVDEPLKFAKFVVEVERYTVAFPLFWGLVLAAPIPWRERGYQILVGTGLVIVPLVLVMVVVTAVFDLSLAINHQPVLALVPPPTWYLALPIPGWIYHLLGVGRQVSLLVLPLVVPVLVWSGFNGELMRGTLLARAAPRSAMP